MPLQLFHNRVWPLCLALFLWIPHSIAATPIDVRVFLFTGKDLPKDYADTIERYEPGIKQFEQAVRESCSIDPIFGDVHQEKLDRKSKPVSFPFTHTGSQNPKEFPYRYYQRPLSAMVDHFRATHHKSRRELNIFYLEELGKHCGYAFPRIQLMNSVKHRATQSQLAKQIGKPLAVLASLFQWAHQIKELSDRVIIDGTYPGWKGCPNPARILAHELAHIFIQDDPVHQCWIDNEWKNCPKENLLAVRVPAPRRPPPFLQPSPFRGTMPPEDNGLFPGQNDPFAQRMIPATGYDLTPRQCKAIKRTIKSWDKL